MSKTQLFKKGQMVPRRLGIVLATNRKAQHHFKFGVDCVWDGRCLVSVRAEHPMIILSEKLWLTGKCGNGTRQRSAAVVPGLLETRELPDGRGIITVYRRDPRPGAERKP